MDISVIVTTRTSETTNVTVNNTLPFLNYQLKFLYKYFPSVFRYKYSTFIKIGKA
jgi:hypothetical protein